MSLRVRLLLGLLLLAALTLLPLGLVLRAALSAYAQAQAQSAVLGQLSLIVSEGTGSASADARAGLMFNRLSRAALDRGSWGVLLYRGQLYATDTARHPQIPAWALAQLGRSGRAQSDGLLLLQAPGGSVLGLSVQDAQIAALLARFDRSFLLAAALSLLATLLLGILLLRLVLNPLREMSRRAAGLDAGNLQTRLPVPRSHDEVASLAGSLNSMLARLEEAFARLSAEEARTRRFAADASHELRTPLAAIQGSLEVLEREALLPADAQLPEARERLLANLRRESRRASRLVDDLLTLNRLDAGEALHREPIELRELLSGVLDSARDLAPGLRFTLEAPELYVKADRGRLEGAVWNLIRNAAAHTPEGGEVRVILQAGPPARLLVQNPATLPEDFLERMFDRFVRGQGAVPGGSGLGLAIVQATARAHGGHTFAQNTPAGLQVGFTLE